MSEYIPKYPSKEGDDSNKTSSELLAETLKPIYVPQDLMLAWESHLASYSRDTSVLLDQVKDSELALNTQYQSLLTRVQKYEQMLQDITMDSNEFTMDSDVENFTGWNILAQASYWDYLLRKEITKLSDQIKSAEYKGGLVTEVTDAVLVGLIADNTYISNVIGALSDTPLIRELDAALTSTVTSITDLQAESVRLAEKQAADAEELANQQVEKAEQLVTAIEASKAEQLNRLAEEAAIRTQLLQELEAKTDAMTADYNAVVDTLHTTVIQELTTMQDGISASVSELKTADEAIITSLDAYKVSNGQNIAALQNSVNVVTNAQESTASQVTGLVASFNTLDSGLSKAQADIIASNQVRADEDEALSQQITTINTGLGEANSRIDTVSDSVSTLDSATAIKFTQLDTRLGGVDDSIASVRQIANSAVDSSSAQATEINTLKSRMATTEGSLATKADASALSSLDTRVGSVEGQYTSQASDITRLSNSLDTTIVDVGTAQTAAQNAMNAAGAKGKVIFGASAPAVEDRLSQNLWIDTTGGSNTPKRWNGASWVVVTDKVASDALSAANAASALVNTKADSSALSTLDSKVDSVDSKVTSNAANITTLQGKVSTVENGLATKADAEALSALTTRVSNTEGGITSQGTRVTNLENVVNHETTGLNSKASSSALTSLDNKVTLVDDKVSVTNSSLLSLEGRVATTENGITSKLDASVIDNYYTKTESDNAIAGKIESYDANLVIGGVNLLKNSEGVFTPSTSKTDNYVIYQSSTVDLVNGKEYTLSGETNGEWDSVHDGAVESNRAVLWLVGNGINAIISNSNVGTKGRTFVWDNPSGTFSLRLNSYRVDNSIWFKKIKIESGNKRTDWTAAPEDVASDINKVQANLSNFQEAQVNVDLAQTNRLNAAESQLGANTARIANVEQTYATRDGVAALARSALQSEWQMYANNSVDNLQIGGRNLLLNSNYSTNPYKIYFAGGSFSQFGLSSVPDQSEAVLDTDTFITVSVWYTQLDSIDINKPFESLVIGRHDLNADLWSIRLYTTDASIKIVKEGNLYKLTGTVLIPKGGQLFANYPRLIAISGYGCYLHKIKIEKGSKATDYSPAPEDLIQDLNTFKSTAETIYSTKAEANSTTADIINHLTSKANQSGLDALSADVANNYYTKAQTDSVTAGVVNSYKAELGNIINYTVVSRGNESGGIGYILNAQGNWIVGGSRSYTLVVFNSDGTINWSRNYDIYGNPGVNQAFYDDINALANGVYVVIFTSDEPASNRNADFIFPALKMLGGTREVNDKLVYRGSYMLIGRKGMVEGTAVELVAPANQTISYALQFVNGVPVGIGNTPTAMPSQFASASALSALDTKVTSIDGKVTTHASSITQLQADVSGNSSKLIVQGDVVNGLKASYVVKTDVNGLVTGYGLYNEGGVGAFGVNADYFYVGNGTTATGGKKPFMVLTSAQTIDGITYPAGTWINTAIIANATIGSAHIADAAITNAKIAAASIDNAKIANLSAEKITAGTIDAARIGAKSITADKIQVDSLSAISADLGTIKVGSANIADLAVDTLQIKDNAVTVPVALNDETVRSRNTQYNSHSYGNPNQVLEDVASIFGNLATITLNRSGGKCRVDASVTVSTVAATTTRSGGYISGVSGSMYCGIILYRNGTPVKRFKIAVPFTRTNEVNVYSGTLVMPIFLDDAAYGPTTYSIRFGVSTTAAGGAIQIHPPSGFGTATVESSSIALIEMKK